MPNRSNNTAVIVAFTVSGIALVAFLLWGGPQLGVYNRTMAGRAALMEAESTRQVKVLEAKAARDSATLKAEAEVERAKGVAEANRIIGESLKGNDEYLKYLYITGLQDQEGNGGEKTVVYIPTDGLVPLPISESARAK